MTIDIKYSSIHNSAIVTPYDINHRKWNLVIGLFQDRVPDLRYLGSSILIPIESFLSLRKPLAVFVKGHGIDLTLSNQIIEFIKDSNLSAYQNISTIQEFSEDDIVLMLKERGFRRTLTNNQLANLKKIGSLPSAATFSVPGAGKTTEALAFFVLNATKDDKLLVVAPKNAFGAWDEQLIDCMGDQYDHFVRLRGGEEKIASLLDEQPRFTIITYQQYPRVANLLAEFIRKNRKKMFVFLDESHRIKSGFAGVSANALLGISSLPHRKLIMSGTPMPQSVKDLIPQFSFLYPDQPVSERDVIEYITPVYVRTNSTQLGIPKVEHRKVLLPMSPLQSEIYKALKFETKRQIIPLLSDLSKDSLRSIGKKVMKVMQFVSNPAILSKDIDFIFDHKLGELLARESAPKIDYACCRARELAAEGKKVLIWSQFVENVELIADRLSDLGADYIHGGVDAGDEDENDTREWKIKQFHTNPNRMVLVANPAACSEGISLHRVCQYAIYVDRSFNAAHYLQSEDRIHRLGLRPDQIPIVEIVECENTIDQLIAQRLEIKVDAMSKALNDSGLNICAMDFDTDYEAEENTFSEDDLVAIRKFFIDI